MRTPDASASSAARPVPKKLTYNEQREFDRLPASIEALEAVFKSHGDWIAAVIVEPVAGNMGCIPPAPGWLETMSALCTKHGSVLIFDEVMTGFRVALGGAQALYGIVPDMTTLGKVIGGGMPVGAFGGRAEVMDRVAPAGPIYQAGTLSGNPMAMAAGKATLSQLDAAAYQRLEETSARLAEGLADAAREAGVPVQVNRVGSMFTVFFSPDPVFDAKSARTCDTKRFGRFFHAMLEGGVYLPPSQFESAFVSVVHSADDVEQTLAAASRAFAESARA